jgi:ribose transport system substrate-binding protein
MNDDQLSELFSAEGMDRATFIRLGAITIILPAAAGALGRRAFAATGGATRTLGKASKPPWTIARAGEGDVNDWVIFLSAHFEYAINQKYKGLFKKYLLTAANFDPTKQVSDVEDLLAQKPDVLLIEPVSEGLLVGAVSKAIAQGVPVVLVSTRVSGNNWTTWVSRNNYKDGVLKGDWIGKKLNGKGNIVALMGLAGTSYANDVWAGSKKSLKKYPGIKILEMQHADWSAPTAKKVTESFLVKYPKIDGILSDGGQMALGAVQAFQDANRAIPPLTADDWNGWMRAASKLPNLQFYAVSGSSGPLATIAVDLAVKILKGEKVAKYHEAPFKTWDQTQLKKWYRPDLADAFWGFNELPASVLKQKFSLKK